MSLQQVVALLKGGAAWDALDALLDEWRLLRHGALAKAANTLARGIEPMPPRSVAVNVMGGRVIRQPGDRLAHVLANPRGPVIEVGAELHWPQMTTHHPRSPHPLQASADLSLDLEVMESLASSPPNPLLQPELRSLIATGAWRDLRLTHPFWTLLEQCGDAEFADAVPELAEHAAGAVALARLRTHTTTRELTDLEFDALDTTIGQAIDLFDEARREVDTKLATLSWRNSDALQVFGDWLQERHDPWGQSSQHALATSRPSKRSRSAIGCGGPHASVPAPRRNERAS